MVLVKKSKKWVIIKVVCAWDEVSRQPPTEVDQEAWVLSSPTQVMENSLPLEDYQRYGRQMIIEGFGLDGQ